MSQFSKAVLLLCMMSLLMTNGQFSSGNSNAAKNVGTEVSIWFNAVLLLILIILFVCSVQFSPKCRRRRKKLPHQIRLEKTNQEISQQRKSLNIKPSSSFINNLYKTMQIQDEYVNIEDGDSDDDDMDDFDGPDTELYSRGILTTESNDSSLSEHDIDDDEEDKQCVAVTVPAHVETSPSRDIVEHGKLLINNLNHYIQTQYDEYRSSHNHVIQDMLGMDAYNNPQQQYRHPSTKNDSDYEPL